jgi:hypothetical protein
MAQQKAKTVILSEPKFICSFAGRVIANGDYKPTKKDRDACMHRAKEMVAELKAQCEAGRKEGCGIFDTTELVEEKTSAKK